MPHPAYDDAQQRWYVHTNAGRKVVHAKNKTEARKRATEKGYKVVRVEPAPPMSEYSHTKTLPDGTQVRVHTYGKLKEG